MAQIAKIDHIKYGGVDYEFVDQTARNNVSSTDKKVETYFAEAKELVNAEAEARAAKDQYLENHMVQIVPGKTLSSNDYTDEDKERVQNPVEFKGATATANGEKGVVKRPLIDDRDKFLKGDGTWGVPENTTYDLVTRSKNGLMSSDDKYKLDTLDITNDELMSGVITFENGKIIEVVDGKTKTTTFNSDGSITLKIEKLNVDPVTITTVFGTDGTITRTRS